jgi:hypothetical protein
MGGITMSKVIDIFSRLALDLNVRGVSDSYEGHLIEYDPQMPITLELFAGLDKAKLIEGCWVPLSWDEKGVVVLVDDPLDIDKQAIIKTELKTEWINFATGIKKDIEAFINRSFSQL